ncbi:hypothetical protein AVEN_208515-1 [Araneus ventricosus]|uniref:Uncharacterized protein n=1 Tax=Araneus ventricosus TaxID=182803 RepID=A0A4Y2E7Y1_ARAVE|nr:hypothetical protein AVEN_208515-1 [Araneus ventricosus]
MLRFRLKARRSRRNGNLTDEEIFDARRTLFRSVQTECFATEEGKISLINLEVYKDDEGILRLKFRLTNEDEFKPPSVPCWGGLWERLIDMLKDLLRKSGGRSSLTYEELQTLVCECEAVMNNRPLTYVSEEPELKTLTPSMFLQDLRVNDEPDLDQVEKTNIVKR